MENWITDFIAAGVVGVVVFLFLVFRTTITFLRLIQNLKVFWRTGHWGKIVVIGATGLVSCAIFFGVIGTSQSGTTEGRTALKLLEDRLSDCSGLSKLSSSDRLKLEDFTLILAPYSLPPYEQGLYHLGRGANDLAKVRFVSVITSGLQDELLMSKTHFFLGLLMEAESDSDSALWYFRQAIAYRGDYLWPRLHISRLLCQENRSQEAFECIDSLPVGYTGTDISELKRRVNLEQKAKLSFRQGSCN